MAPKKIVCLIYHFPDKDDISELSEIVALQRITNYLNQLNKKNTVFLFLGKTVLEVTEVDIKTSKLVILTDNAENVREIKEKMFSNADPETGADTIVITPLEKTKIVESSEGIVKAGDVLKCEDLKELDDWYPHLLTFIYEKPVTKHPDDRKPTNCFLFDKDNELEREWVNKKCAIIRQLGGTVCAAEEVQELVQQEDETLDGAVNTVVIVSSGDGHNLMAENKDTIEKLSKTNSRFLIFTDNPKRGIARDIKSRKVLAVYSCEKTLRLDHMMWASLLQNLSMIDCKDTMKPKSKALKVLKIVGIVAAVLILGSLALALFAALVVLVIMFPKFLRLLRLQRLCQTAPSD